MKRERDTQRKRIYKSDHAITPMAKPLPTVTDMERYVKRMCEMKRVRDAFPNARLGSPPVVKDGRGRIRAGGCSQYVTMPLWSRNEAIMLHELAHCIVQRQHGMYVAAHGWQFASVYLTLVLYGMGREAHDTLKAAFKKNRVRFTAPRKKAPMDPVRKAELIARLAAYRQQMKEAA
jgi:putative metallohydrolase (TIGR04338 family)